MQKEQLYELLMNKPIPKSKKQHDIKINKVEILEAEDPKEESQIVKAVVVDKTDENRIDRDDALMRIRRAKKKALEPKSVLEIRKASVIPTKITDADPDDRDDLFREDREPEPEPEAVPETEEDKEAKEEEKPAASIATEYSVQAKEEKPKIVIATDDDDEEPEPQKPKDVKKDKGKKQKAIPLSDDYALPKIPEDLFANPPVYILNSRETFIRETNKALAKQFKHLEDSEASVVSCDARSESKFDLLTHQKIVRFYLNLFSPHRGLLLYHGLGAGKTCSSIAIAEGMKNYKKVLIMTPASLRMNYIEELKKCGDDLYKRGQHWEFINTVMKPDMIPLLKKILVSKIKYLKTIMVHGLLMIKKKPTMIHYHQKRNEVLISRSMR